MSVTYGNSWYLAYAILRDWPDDLSPSWQPLSASQPALLGDSAIVHSIETADNPAPTAHPHRPSSFPIPLNKIASVGCFFYAHVQTTPCIICVYFFLCCCNWSVFNPQCMTRHFSSGNSRLNLCFLFFLIVQVIWEHLYSAARWIWLRFIAFEIHWLLLVSTSQWLNGCRQSLGRVTDKLRVFLFRFPWVGLNLRTVNRSLVSLWSNSDKAGRPYFEDPLIFV